MANIDYEMDVYNRGLRDGFRIVKRALMECKVTGDDKELTIDGIIETLDNVANAVSKKLMTDDEVQEALRRRNEEWLKQFT